MMKHRAKAEWGTSLSEVLAQKPYGTGVKTIQLDGNTVLVHFTFDKSTSEEEISQFGKQIRKVLPSNALAIFTVDGIKIDVHRPPPPPAGRLDMQFIDTVFGSDEQVKQLTEVLDKLTKEGVEAHVSFQNCNIRQMWPVPQPANFVKVPEATLGRPIQPDVDELAKEGIQVEDVDELLKEHIKADPEYYKVVSKSEVFLNEHILLNHHKKE